MESAPNLFPAIKFDFAAAKTKHYFTNIPDGGQVSITHQIPANATHSQLFLSTRLQNDDLFFLNGPFLGQDKRPLFLKALPLGRCPGRQRSGRADSFIVGSHAIIPPRLYPDDRYATIGLPNALLMDLQLHL
ncbi:MAG: hypothetical protein JO316_19810 [Abitibacteriaceae bacterium]|nr:hypothetical protein [Abditibacteriaceae bacterium]